MKQLVEKYKEKGKSLGISFGMDTKEEGFILEYEGIGIKKRLGGTIHTFSQYVFLKLYGQGKFEKNNSYSQTLIQFLISFLKDLMEETNSSFAIIETAVSDFDSLSSLSRLETMEQITPLLNELEMDGVYALYGLEKEKGSIKTYLNYFSPIIRSLRKIEAKHELFSYYANFENFQLKMISFSLFDERDELTFNLDETREKPFIFSQKRNNGSEQITEVKEKDISSFFDTVFEKKQQSLRLKYLSNPPRNQFYRFINSFRTFKINSPIPDALHHEFMSVFKGDYLKIESMAKSLILKQDVLTKYDLKHDRIVYFTFENMCFIVAFYKKNDPKFLFKHVPLHEAEKTIQDITLAIISNHMKKETEQ